MNKSIRRKCTAAVMVLAFAVACAGCDLAAFSVITNAASWTSGWATGALTAISQVGTTCYVNGVQVDCSTLPEGM